MDCPKCSSYLIYDEIVDEAYDTDTYSRRWEMKCPKCDFHGYLWETYRLESEEWDNEESNC